MPAVQAATVAALILCLLVPGRSPLFWLLNRKTMVRIGVLSYSLYVWHFLFLAYFAPHALPFPILTRWTIWWIPAALTALLSYECMELPLLRLRRHLRRTPLPGA